jgi:hypothetical protein
MGTAQQLLNAMRKFAETRANHPPTPLCDNAALLTLLPLALQTQQSSQLSESMKQLHSADQMTPELTEGQPPASGQPHSMAQHTPSQHSQCRSDAYSCIINGWLIAGQQPAEQHSAAQHGKVQHVTYTNKEGGLTWLSGAGCNPQAQHCDLQHTTADYPRAAEGCMYINALHPARFKCTWVKKGPSM